ncbi:MAG: hypothetical protein IJ274_09135 [Lachnospiraceae bacterium]|nr:hypothetical protein [Lachnospiraceae bacterium]
MSLYESHEYDDIIDLPYQKSQKHPHMDLYDRAAQFSPFAALTGFESAIEETGRITEERIELDENAKEALDLRFREIFEKLRHTGAEKPFVTITYFRSDSVKEGGAYVTVEGRIKKIDENSHRLIFEDGLGVDMDEVIGVGIIKE